jgi:Transposase IS116/IS110/IS902 family
LNHRPPGPELGTDQSKSLSWRHLQFSGRSQLDKLDKFPRHLGDCPPDFGLEMIGLPYMTRTCPDTYIGLIPCEDSCARKQRLGHISKQGSSLLRFLLIEAAQAAARAHPDWRRRYIHLAVRRHRSIAKVAMGRRLAIRLYWMWRNGCDYSPSLEFGSYAGQLGCGYGVK